MKKIVSLAMTLTMLMTAATACAPQKQESSAAETAAYTKKEVNAYLLNESTPTVFNCLFREDLPEVPFVDAEDYLNRLFTEKVSFQKGGNGVYTFTNGDFAVTVDAKNDTVSSDCIEGFVITNHKQNSESENADFIRPGGFSTEDEIKPVFIDLAKYDIDIAEADGRVYLPYCTLSDMFADTGCIATFKKDELYFKSAYDTLTAGGGQGKLEDTRSKAMAEFSYRELCFTMDYAYGMPSMSVLSDSIRQKGFDQTLSDYNSVTPKIREMLLSENTKEYCRGVRLLNYYLNDGGHTQMDNGMQRMIEKYSIPNVAAVAEEVLDESEPERAAIRAAVDKSAEKDELKKSLIAEKSAAYAKLECIASQDGTSLYRSGDTYYFDFNGFDNNLAGAFKAALDYAEANHAKNFVIDLSTNNGGSDYLVNFMLSLMLGNDTHLCKSSVSDSTFKTNVLVDKNLDGEFDKKDDAVSYGFRFAVITSQYSYSNANCMPCAAQDRGVAILGEVSGGGSCIVSAHFYPDGCLYSISGTSYNIHPNGKDVDAGTKPDTALPGAAEGYKGFYDFDAIDAGIDAFYAKA